MEKALWRMPARLLRFEAGGSASKREGRRVELARGPLAELISIAAEVGDEEGPSLLIECVGAPQRLVWADIRALRREPTFPVDI
jgi:hypothetical protein